VESLEEIGFALSPGMSALSVCREVEAEIVAPE
jgi:hypothetical protein